MDTIIHARFTEELAFYLYYTLYIHVQFFFFYFSNDVHMNHARMIKERFLYVCVRAGIPVCIGLKKRRIIF